MTFDFFDQPVVLTQSSWLILTAAILGLILFIAVIYIRVMKGEPWQQAPSSRIAMQLASSFKPSDRFSGFVDDKSSASVVIVELPVEAYDQIKMLGDNPGALAAQGVTGIREAELPGRSGDHVYLTGVQKTPLVDYLKYILIFRGAAASAMITVNVPEAALKSRAISEKDVQELLASAEFRDKALSGPVLFEFGYLGDFEEDTSLLGNTKGYRLKHSSMNGQGGTVQPLLLVAPSLDKLPLTAPEETARNAFGSLDQFRGAEITGVRRVNIAGVEAIELTGLAAESKSGEEAMIYQLLVPAVDGGYFRLVGISPKADMEQYLGEFRRIAESFRPVTGTGPSSSR